MRIGILRESGAYEPCVALTPDDVGGLVRQGHEVLVEAGAGMGAGFADEDYRAAGGRVVSGREAVLGEAEVILSVRASAESLAGGARPGTVVIGLLDPLGDPRGTAALAGRGLTLFAMDFIPRISRAQPMDALSSLATVAGYKAVLLAAHHLPRFFPLLMTAAGTIAPAKVLVLGAGVAGLQAIATARRLGAVVRAYDVRPEVREQVQSLGATFVELGLETESARDEGGYAREMGEAFYRRQRELLAPWVAESDVVITTASVPGRRAPILIDAEAVRRMRPGSVIVDLAAERGGNCALTVPGETVVEHGVTIIGPRNLPATMSHHACKLYARNITNFLLHLLEHGGLTPRLDDEIIRETLVARDGAVVHPRLSSLPREGVRN